MTQNSSIWIETDDTPEEVQRALERATPFRIAPDFGHRKEMIAERTTLSISPTHPHDYEPSKAGLRSNLHLFFSNMDKNSSVWEINMLHAAMALLRAYPGDLLYMYLLHSPVLMRKQGRLILQRHSDAWDPQYKPDLLDLIDLPYEWGEIPLP